MSLGQETSEYFGVLLEIGEYTATAELVKLVFGMGLCYIILQGFGFVDLGCCCSLTLPVTCYVATLMCSCECRCMLVN